MLRRFIAGNKAICNKLESRLPQAKTRLPYLYEETVARYMNERIGQTVVDIGGGKSCHFAKYKDPEADTKIIAVDISEKELEENQDVDDKRVADVTRSLPLSDDEVDIIASRFVLEHLEHMDDFVRDSGRVLKRGGYSIHLFPSKFAPYALINQALPDSVARALLYLIRPETKTGCGFPAFYDKCYYSAMETVFQEHGFEITDAHFHYYQSQYFKFFTPLFLASVMYELLLMAVKARNLCPYTLVVARKR